MYFIDFLLFLKIKLDFLIFFIKLDNFVNNKKLKYKLFNCSI